MSALTSATWSHRISTTGEEGRVVTMIDWNSDKWGNNVHFAANGSWVDDKHADADRREQ